METTVVFTDDANILSFAPYPMAREHLANYVAAFAANGIDILSWTAMINGVCWYGTKVGQRVFGHRSDFPHFEVRLLRANIDHMSGVGADPLEVVAQQCHGNGMRMIACFRMGLSRFVDDTDMRESRHGVYYNEFAAAHPEMAIQNVAAGHGYGYVSGRALDFSYPEVREQVLAPMREVAQRFDVDGFELNFIRGNLPFESHEAPGKAPIMTAFVAAARRILDEGAADRRGIRPLLCVRVPDSLEWCRECGLDVGAWIKDGLADFVMPSQIHGIRFDARIEDFVALCGGTDCRVLPSVQPGLPYTLPQLRAAADWWYRNGAAGISAFNFNHRARWRGSKGLLSQAEILGWFRELRDPDMLATGERVYSFFKPASYHENHCALESLSFSRAEVGVRKTLYFPPMVEVAMRDPGARGSIRFMAEELAWDDDLEVDVDQTVLPGLKKELDVPRHFRDMIAGVSTHPRGEDSSLWPAYRVELPLPRLDRYRELGIRLIKRSKVATDVELKELEVMINASP